MKTKSIIIAVIASLSCLPTALAQKKIKDAFADVVKMDGVTVTGEKKLASTIDPNRMTAESSIVNIKVQGKKAYHAVFDKLKEAFDDEGKNASSVVTEAGFEGVEMDSAVVQGLGLRGHPMNIWREDAASILVGTMQHNSSYRIANFEDQEHPDYRTCYAAEWCKTNVPDIYTAQLVYVYGRKPESMLNYPNGQSDIIRKQLDELGVKVDTCFTWSGTNFSFNNAPRDIPYTGSVSDWMNKAMENVKHLSNSDWHRFFGLLTQKMMDKANKESMEDLIVAAGIILDLCKNAEQLDDEERRISSNRLLEVALHFDSDKHQYIHDLLTLGAQKLEKKGEKP